MICGGPTEDPRPGLRDEREGLTDLGRDEGRETPAGDEAHDGGRGVVRTSAGVAEINWGSWDANLNRRRVVETMGLVMESCEGATAGRHHSRTKRTHFEVSAMICRTAQSCPANS